jgi:hypothetical protein
LNLQKDWTKKVSSMFSWPKKEERTIQIKYWWLIRITEVW